MEVTLLGTATSRRELNGAHLKNVIVFIVYVIISLVINPFLMLFLHRVVIENETTNLKEIYSLFNI